MSACTPPRILVCDPPCALMRAAAAVDEDRLPAAMEEVLADAEHPGVDCCTAWLDTPLVLFAEGGKVAAVRLLLTKTAKVDGWNRSPLNAAVGGGCEEVALCLIEAGADPTKDDSTFGHTPLERACALGQMAVVRAIIARGVNPDASSFARYPLWSAAEADQTRVVRCLLAAGADPRRILDGESLMSRAAKWGAIGTVKLLLRAGVEPDHAAPHGYAGLAKAAARGHTRIMHALLKAGADVDGRPTCGLTPLMYAAQKGRPEAVRILIEHGASAELRDHIGRTPMMIATGRGNFDCVYEIRRVTGGGRRVRRRRA